MLATCSRLRYALLAIVHPAPVQTLNLSLDFFTVHRMVVSFHMHTRMQEKFLPSNVKLVSTPFIILPQSNPSRQSSFSFHSAFRETLAHVTRCFAPCVPMCPCAFLPFFLVLYTLSRQSLDWPCAPVPRSLLKRGKYFGTICL